MSDIHALSGAYAVDALDDAERAEFEQHLTVCADCRAEVASLRETAALLSDAESETPPESLRAGVLSGIRQVRPLPPETPSGPVPVETGPTEVRRRRLPALLVAAAAIVLLAAGALAWHPWHHDRTEAEQILSAADATRVTRQLAGGGELTLVRSPSLKKAVLVGRDVPDAGPGKTYQMWLQQPGEDLVSAGLVPDADRPTVLSGDAATAAAAAVSVEPEGGSVRPSKNVVAVFSLQPASG